MNKLRSIYPPKPYTLTHTMNLFDANSIISTLGLIGVLGVIFMETGLLIGLVFPGGEIVFLAGIAASGSGEVILGEAKLSAPLLFTLAPIAAITGGELGYWFGKKYGASEIVFGRQYWPLVMQNETHYKPSF